MSCINENFLKSPLAEKHQKDLFYLLLICIITGSLYAPFMHFPFLPLWDDGRFVLYNKLFYLFKSKHLKKGIIKYLHL